MNPLAVPLTSITDQGLSIGVDVPDSEWTRDVADSLPLSELRIEGSLTSIGPEYLFRGFLFGAFENPCDRCLERTRWPFKVEVAWLFEPGVAEERHRTIEEVEMDQDSDEPEPSYRFDGLTIDLGEPVREETLLALPTKYLCGSDCQGLCPDCGANLNRTPCDCHKKEQLNASGLAGLAEMFPDLRPGSTEE